MQLSVRLPLVPLALAHVGLFTAGLLAFGLLTQGARLPTPMDPSSVAQQFYLANGTPIRVAALLQFASALPLGLWASALGQRGRIDERPADGNVVA